MMMLGHIRKRFNRNANARNENEKCDEILKIAVPRESNIGEHPLKKQHRPATHHSTPL
jgi:hypothetical protein